MAKTQFNNTWEISAVPYIPVTHLILRHCENLASKDWHLRNHAEPDLRRLRLSWRAASRLKDRNDENVFRSPRIR